MGGELPPMSRGHDGADILAASLLFYQWVFWYCHTADDVAWVLEPPGMASPAGGGGSGCDLARGQASLRLWGPPGLRVAQSNPGVHVTLHDVGMDF